MRESDCRESRDMLKYSKIFKWDLSSFDINTNKLEQNNTPNNSKDLIQAKNNNFNKILLLKIIGLKVLFP